MTCFFMASLTNSQSMSSPPPASTFPFTVGRIGCCEWKSLITAASDHPHHRFQLQPGEFRNPGRRIPHSVSPKYCLQQPGIGLHQRNARSLQLVIHPDGVHVKRQLDRQFSGAGTPRPTIGAVSTSADRLIQHLHHLADARVRSRPPQVKPVGDRERYRKRLMCSFPLHLVVDIGCIEHGVEILFSLPRPGRSKGVPNRLRIGHGWIHDDVLLLFRCSAKQTGNFWEVIFSAEHASYSLLGRYWLLLFLAFTADEWGDVGHVKSPPFMWLSWLW